jgi:hypothetical protein
MQFQLAQIHRLRFLLITEIVESAAAGAAKGCDVAEFFSRHPLGS